MKSIFNKTRFSWLNMVSATLVLCSLMIWMVLPSFAQDSGDEEEGEDYGAENINCLDEELVIGMMGYYNDMTTFLGTHYESDEPASELLETALLKFDEFELNMYGLIIEQAVAQAGQSIDQETNEIKKCTELVSLKISEVEQMMRNHHLQNAANKTTYTLVTKLKDINDGLRDMNQDFAQMYALFKSLQSKLTAVTD